ncbi:hypothetical protein DFH07DRAFT_736241 [Mycena maculata]|uniref:Alpha-type protein kinase domain-containing protein n=1 Tax=Mycena maculata TaxID=230809 RepID=A0AAD7JP09_9AGAR|nr:hypothetical protein DFH07DRAFT_736241 [Mycena maculata]
MVYKVFRALIPYPGKAIFHRYFFQVILDGLPWVAKRYFNIGAGEGLVDIGENHDQVVKEVTRQSRTSYFLTRFIAGAQRQGVDIDQGIHVTDFKLAVEVVPGASGPSRASGFSIEQYNATRQAEDNANNAGSNTGIIVWLFEPRRSSKVQHWSGTNEYPPWHRNKLGSTLNAFAHYAYLLSLESTVFCDLQSKSNFVLLFKHFSQLHLSSRNGHQRERGWNSSLVRHHDSHT